MFEDSEEQIFRTGKHCRERWLNYLDPSKERGEWTTEDDDYLLAKVHESGKKWS
jgi:Myb-like DNA-binding protein FlbD